jgi:hypothetical protein
VRVSWQKLGSITYGTLCQRQAYANANEIVWQEFTLQKSRNYALP